MKVIIEEVIVLSRWRSGLNLIDEPVIAFYNTNELNGSET